MPLLVLALVLALVMVMVTRVQAVEENPPT
jgi:hypothetical protein